MSGDNRPEYEIIARGDLIMLRTYVKKDRTHYEKWQKQGEWRSFDTPWEQSKPEEKKSLEEKKTQTEMSDDPSPKKKAIISTWDNTPLGWVNRYRSRGNSPVRFVGIDICEDNYLNRGYGTEALSLWVNYLFENSEYHKLCLDTWSFNTRMARVAEKVGFISEGCQREMQLWQDEWLDLLHYGLLREEWEASRIK